MKKIDINDEEQILKECDFDYFYNSERCSRELNMFYYDIYNQNANFNKKQALIDLGRIAITLNEQDEKIKELEEQLELMTELRNNAVEEATINLDRFKKTYDENQQLKQSQNDKAIEVLENIVKFMDGDIYSNYYPMAYEIKEFILEQITKLRGGEND